jgi:hypothetical protein
MNEIIITGMLSVVFLLMCGISYVLDLIAGDAKLPTFRKQKKPRSVAAKRGMVGQKIRRTRYEYIEIVPQTDPRVKGLCVERVRK